MRNVSRQGLTAHYEETAQQRPGAQTRPLDGSAYVCEDIADGTSES
jgi:hypothetical protein